MAKTKRKQAALVNRQRRLFEIHKKHFWCADGTMLEQLIVGGVQKLGSQHEEFIDFVINNRHTWQIISIVFCKVGDRHDFKTMHFEKTGRIKDIQPEINAEADKLIAAENKHHFVSWGWWATPAGNVDLEQVEQGVIDQFDSYGAWDADLVAVQMAQRFKKPETEHHAI